MLCIDILHEQAINYIDRLSHGGAIIEKKRFSHIDIIEAVAIFFVVFYHTTLYQFDFLAKGDVIFYWRYFARTILSTCVPLFFFANGYLLFSKSYYSRRHLKRTAKMALLPLLGLILCPIYMIIAGQRIVWKSVILSWLNLDTYWSMNLFWYAGTLVCIYILFPALKALYDSNEKSFMNFVWIIFLLTFGIKLCNVLLAFVNIAVNLPIKGINYPLIDMYVPFRKYGYSFVYFCLGGIAYRRENDIKPENSVLAVSSIIVACTLLFVTGILHSKYIINGIWDVVWDGYDTVPTLINVLAIYVLSLNTHGRCKLIETISKDTLGIYLFHGLIIRMTRPALKEISACQNLIINAVYAIFVIVICIAAVEVLRKIPIIKKLI